MSARYRLVEVTDRGIVQLRKECILQTRSNLAFIRLRHSNLGQVISIGWSRPSEAEFMFLILLTPNKPQLEFYTLVAEYID